MSYCCAKINHTRTVRTVSKIALKTSTVERASSVVTLGADVTVVGEILTFVNICREITLSGSIFGVIFIRTLLA